MKEKIKQVTLDDEEKMQILLRAIDRMPLNPSAQGWSGAAVRRQLAASITGEQHSVLSNLISKLAIVQDLFYEVEGRFQALDISAMGRATFSTDEPLDKTEGHLWFRILEQNGSIRTELYRSDGTEFKTVFIKAHAGLIADLYDAQGKIKNSYLPAIIVSGGEPADASVWLDTTSAVEIDTETLTHTPEEMPEGEIETVNLAEKNMLIVVNLAKGG